MTLLTADTRLKDRTVQYQVQSSSALTEQDGHHVSYIDNTQGEMKFYLLMALKLSTLFAKIICAYTWVDVMMTENKHR